MYLIRDYAAMILAKTRPVSLETIYYSHVCHVYAAAYPFSLLFVAGAAEVAGFGEGG